MPAPDQKERDWIDLGLKASTPLIVGLVVAWVSIYGDEALNKLSHRQQTARLITQLQIGREQAESALRKDIFTRALDDILTKDSQKDGEPAKVEDFQQSADKMSKQLLRLELLALNFGDSLSLTPLFVEMNKDLRALRHRAPHDKNSIKGSEFVEWDKLIMRLTSLAKRVSSSQLSALLQHGEEIEINVPLDGLEENFDNIKCEYRTDDIVPKRAYDDQSFPWPHGEATRYTREIVRTRFAPEVQRLIGEISGIIAGDVSNLEKLKEGAKEEEYITERAMRELRNTRLTLTNPNDSLLMNLNKQHGEATIRHKVLLSAYQVDQYYNSGEKQAGSTDAVYQEFKTAVNPILSLENAPSDDPKVIEAWEDLKSRFDEESSGSGMKQFSRGRRVFRSRSIIEEDDPDTNLRRLVETTYPKKMQEGTLVFQDVRRDVEVHISKVDHCQKSLRVDIIIKREVCGDEGCKFELEGDPGFRLDFFNFPIVDNTRLTGNHRLAAVIEDFDTISKKIDISLVVFPSEYASLRDRPGMEEVRKLLEKAMKFEPDGKN